MWGDFFGEIVIFGILDVIGATVRWLFFAIWNALFDRPYRNMKYFLTGSRRNNEEYDESISQAINWIIAILFIVGIMFLFVS